MSFFLAALSLGFLGSFHCLGMCGPIALSLPVHHAGTFKKIILILTYNFGRILTYSTFGLIAGSIGQSVALAGYQQILSITIGALLLLSVFVPATIQSKIKITSIAFNFFNRVKNELSKLFLKKGNGSLFLIGLLNGLLPCGLVYMGIAGAIATGSAVQGAGFMALFGLGTVPLMFSLPIAGSFITVNTRNAIRKTVPVMITLTALLLILRGLNLGIPYVSPKIQSQTGDMSCHIEKSVENPKGSIKCSGTNSVHHK